MVLTTSILQAFARQADPAVLANAYNASVIENNPYVDLLLIFPKVDWHRKKIVLQLRHERLDLVIDPLLSPNPDSARAIPVSAVDVNGMIV